MQVLAESIVSIFFLFEQTAGWGGGGAVLPSPETFIPTKPNPLTLKTPKVALYKIGGPLFGPCLFKLI